MDEETLRALRTNIAVALATCPKHHLKGLTGKLPIEADAARAAVAAHIADRLGELVITRGKGEKPGGAPNTGTMQKPGN